MGRSRLPTAWVGGTVTATDASPGSGVRFAVKKAPAVPVGFPCRDDKDATCFYPDYGLNGQVRIVNTELLRRMTKCGNDQSQSEASNPKAIDARQHIAKSCGGHPVM